MVVSAMKNRSRGLPRQGLAYALFAALGLLWSAPVHAQAAPREEPGPIARALKLRTSVPPAPDFVARTRPPADSMKFIPAHARRVAPPSTPMTPDQIRAKERELDGLRAKQDRLAGRASPPAAPRSVADGGAQKRRPPAPIRCVLTCPEPTTLPATPGHWIQIDN